MAFLSLLQVDGDPERDLNRDGRAEGTDISLEQMEGKYIAGLPINA